MVIVLGSESESSGFESSYAYYATVLSNTPGLDCFLVIREVMFSSSVGRIVLKPK